MRLGQPSVLSSVKTVYLVQRPKLDAYVYARTQTAWWSHKATFSPLRAESRLKWNTRMCHSLFVVLSSKEWNFMWQVRWVPGALYPVVKRPGREANDSAPTETSLPKLTRRVCLFILLKWLNDLCRVTADIYLPIFYYLCNCDVILSKSLDILKNMRCSYSANFKIILSVCKGKLVKLKKIHNVETHTHTLHLIFLKTVFTLNLQFEISYTTNARQMLLKSWLATCTARH
jgi:hypothetical protein